MCLSVPKAAMDPTYIKTQGRARQYECDFPSVVRALCCLFGQIG